MAEPKAPETIDGWKWDGFTNYASYVKRNVDVSFDGTGLETSETVSGYEGYTSRVSVSLPLLRALLAHLGLHIVSEADKRVLDAMAALHIDNVSSYDHESNKRHWEYPAMMSELARRKP